MKESMRIVPARTFILKLTDRCNIACQYCYVFEFDKTHSAAQPARMSRRVFELSIARIKSHLEKTRTKRPIIQFHGGEPLLLGKAAFREYARIIRTELGSVVGLSLQTNGLLLDEEWLDLFRAEDINFCVSLDGPPTVNDKYRLTKLGQPTAHTVLTALGLVKSHAARDLFRGILAVVDPASDGAAVVKYFVSLGLTQFDFLFPDGNHATPPFHLAKTRRRASDFLVEAFDAWYLADDPTIKIRFFSEVISSLLGNRSTLDFFGNVNGSIAVFETDGGMLVHDVLKICGAPHNRSVLHVTTNDVDELMDVANFPWREPAAKCKTCDVWDICGGGYAPHRYDGENFDNPSFYCNDIERLIRHIAMRILSGVADPGTHDRVETIAAKSLLGEAVE